MEGQEDDWDSDSDCFPDRNVRIIAYGVGWNYQGHVEGVLYSPQKVVVKLSDRAYHDFFLDHRGNLKQDVKFVVNEGKESLGTIKDVMWCREHNYIYATIEDKEQDFGHTQYGSSVRGFFGASARRSEPRRETRAIVMFMN